MIAGTTSAEDNEESSTGLSSGSESKTPKTNNRTFADENFSASPSLLLQPEVLSLGGIAFETGAEPTHLNRSTTSDSNSTQDLLGASMVDTKAEEPPIANVSISNSGKGVAKSESSHPPAVTTSFSSDSPNSIDKYNGASPSGASSGERQNNNRSGRTDGNGNPYNQNLPQALPSPRSGGSHRQSSRVSGSRRSRNQSHNRVHSWSTDGNFPGAWPTQEYQGQIGPPPMVSASGNPLIPILNGGAGGGGAGAPGYPPPSQGTSLLTVSSPRSGGRRKRKQQNGSRPRANSYNQALPPTSYGSFPHDEFGDGLPPPAPPMPPPQQTPTVYPPQSPYSSSKSPADFSPRSELLNLTKSLSGRRLVSPDTGAMPGSSPSGSPAVMGRKNIPAPASPYHTAAPASPYRQASPRGMASYSPNLSTRSAPAGVEELHLSPENAAYTQMPHTDRGVYSVPESGNMNMSEAESFLPQNFGKHHHSRRSTHPRTASHKMHMRQQSVNLYMEEAKGTDQPTACRDVLFSLLFVLHLVCMGYLGMTYGKDAIVHSGDISSGSFGEDRSLAADNLDAPVILYYHNVVKVALVCGVFAIALSAMALLVMMMIARHLVQVALVFSIVVSFAWGTVGIGFSPSSFVPVTGIVAVALSVGYTFVVWDRIPFASANLATALSGLRSNFGAVIIAFLCQFVALLWTIYYTFAALGVYDALDSGDIVISKRMRVFVYVVFGISYYWTYRVLMNVVRVTVAGVIGKWWFKSNSSCCNESVMGSFARATFFSFGSIAFGSLLIGPIMLLRQLVAFVRPNEDESTALACLHECLHCFQQCAATCVDSLSDHFNPWAFTYVGLYGYNLLDSGHNAATLFRKRGWTMIVTDDLIPNVLMMVSIVIGGMTGCFGLLIEEIGQMGFTSLDSPTVTAFLIGVAVGLVLSSILFGVIHGSVMAAIVCFAGSPVEFDKEHPNLSQEMRTAWREVWPGCMEVTDMKLAMAV